jgi:hypothetical protein
VTPVLPLAISTPALGVVIVAGTILVALAASFLARRMIPRDPLERSQDAVSVMFSAVGVLYTVLLAFLVVLVWEQFNAAQEQAEHESTKISNLLRDAVPFPTPARQAIQCRLIIYTHSVVDDEWDTMANGESSPETRQKYERIWAGYYGFHPRTERQHDFYTESISKLNELGEERRLRLISSAASIPWVMWVLLVVGAVITIAYLYLFAIPDAFLQHVMIGSVAGLLAFILFMILALDHPFAGDVKVTPDAYQAIVDSYDDGGYGGNGRVGRRC